LDNNNHIITLKVTPFQYYPKLNQLEELDNIQINLTLKPNSKKIILPNARTFKTQEIWDNALEYIVDNKGDIQKYHHKPKLTLEIKNNDAKLKKPSSPEFFVYTIITNRVLKPYFNDFVNWKKSKGIDAGVVTLASIYANYQGDYISNLFDNAGKIRQYLRDLYEADGTFVLLAGDFSIVPIRYGCGYATIESWDYTAVNPPIIDAYKIPTDLYYADRNGNWNVDGDEWTGQGSDDNPDYYPEFFVGRLLCTTG